MDQFSQYIPVVVPMALACMKALAVLLAGYFLSKAAKRWMRWVVSKTDQIDDTLGNFFATMIGYVVLIITLLTVLQLFGVQVASLLAILGAATLAVALALQGTLTNVASGVMLVIFRPFKLGDWVTIEGNYGKVSDLNLFFTEVTTLQNTQVIIPNSTAWGTVVCNHTGHENHCLNLEFNIHYKDDVNQAMLIIERAATDDPRVLPDPAPKTKLSELGEYSINLTSYIWCKSDDYWELQFDLLKSVKEGFDQGGIRIPYPHAVEIKADD
ncbi:mechanosensitive ion channel family protein [Alphaproteobacteria bacterium]|nr:mechanosensitive ion channel family protein [Alphaproteobacteria bacterium]